MRRNCNLELHLLPPSSACLPLSPEYSSPTSDVLLNRSPNEEQQLTIFYDGKVTVCDVTDLQARAIILLASREMEERSSQSPTSSEPSLLLLQPQLHSPTGLSLKKSLQRFVQKRKIRIQGINT